MNKALPLQAKIEIAIFAALALLLDLLPSIKIATAVSISFSMVPIFIMCFRWGGKRRGSIWSIMGAVAVGNRNGLYFNSATNVY
ncbi:hypothetical protein BMD_2524 [Priestia megaterium DSM 319]|uniref:Uncharacterized protein n=1 Tax=Priestia megaterium (strain DSM 319 / IMG 1521) TaxID=592022 RepID=D5DET7_PRIM3|nr:hypothetical protein BMD_2524 [Priestia megaterium DSM 319]